MRLHLPARHPESTVLLPEPAHVFRGAANDPREALRLWESAARVTVPGAELSRADDVSEMAGSYGLEDELDGDDDPDLADD